MLLSEKMNSRTIALVAFGLFVFILVSALFIFTESRSPPAPSPSDSLASCKTISYNGPEKFNLLFIGSNSQTEKYSSLLFEEEPYASRKNEFNIYSIENEDTSTFCKTYKDIAALCHTKELFAKAASCPYNFIFVLTDQDSRLRSSAYKNVVSLNINHPQSPVLRHEIGHLYGLAEEYTPASLPRGQKNCKSSCAEFGTSIDKCSKGCSSSELYRSIESGVMRTLDTTKYGVYNEFLIAEKISEEPKSTAQLTGRAIAEQKPCAEQEYFRAFVDGSADSLLISSVEKHTGCAAGNPKAQNQILIQDKDSNIISVSSFADDSLFTDAPGEDKIEGETFEEQSYWLTFPAAPGASSLVLKDSGGTEMARVSLEGKNQLCIQN